MKRSKTALALPREAWVVISGMSCPIVPAALLGGRVVFVEGDEQCDRCGVPLTGTDLAPNAIRVTVHEFALGVQAEIACQCGQAFAVETR